MDTRRLARVTIGTGEMIGLALGRVGEAGAPPPSPLPAATFPRQHALDATALDGNPPLAGQNLHFDVNVLEVREATAEEIAHGHVHGLHDHDH